MKTIKNFVIWGILVSVSVGLGGCGSYVMSSGKDKLGNVRLVSGTQGLGSNAYYGTLSIDNDTPYPFYVCQGGFIISVDSDKKTHVMTSPGANFYTEDNGALIGGASVFTLVFRDTSDKRTIATRSLSCWMRVRGGVINNIWTAYMRDGEIYIDTSHSIGGRGGYGGLRGYR